MKPKLKKFLMVGSALSLFSGIGLLVIFSLTLVNGPRMIHQEHVRTFETARPLPPGSIPITADRVSPKVSTDSGNTPPEDTSENRQRGATYYGYYCQACHGSNGNGHGPVGESYMPVPADLSAGRIQNYDDPHLIQAMIKGVGHEPVLENIVPAEHRRFLALYVRTFSER